MSIRLSVLLSLIVLLIMIQPVQAQISKESTPPSFNNSVTNTIPTVITADVNVAALLAEDELEVGKDIPLRFGYPFDVRYDLDNSGQWEVLPNGDRIWRLRIESPGAYSINLIYAAFWLPEGAKLFIYNEDHSHVIGAFTSDNNKDHGQFSTQPVKGEVSILEYYEPVEVAGRGIIDIERIVHAYRNMFSWDTFKDSKGFGSSGSCNNNVRCPEGDPWDNQIRSTAMVILSGGSRWCSGSMVNNVRQDLTPYFLTAEHCMGSSNTWIIMFNYESPSCDNIDGPTWMTISGTTYRASNTFSDFGLVELSSEPPETYNVYYAGWSAVDTPADSCIAIHHPSGDIKKISFDYGTVTSTSYLGTSSGNNSHWRIGNWEDGTTEGGSSGSQLINREGKIIGQLHGGYASCTSITADWYGKFSQSWNYGGSASTRLKDWLDPDNTGVSELDGKDAARTSITHTPLEDTQDTLNDYAVYADITSANTLIADSLLVYYQVSSIWYEDTMSFVSGDEYVGYIPAQQGGTEIDYYIYATDNAGQADTTDTFSFKVLDYGVTMSPEYDTLNGPVYGEVWFDLTVTNTGVFGDDYDLTISGNSWTTDIYDVTQSYTISSTGTLVSNQSFDFKIRVEIPSSAYGDFDLVEITATSTSDGSISATSQLRTVSEGEPLTIPFADDFPTTTIDQGKWILNATCESNDDGLNEPSPDYSLNLDGYSKGMDTLMSQMIDLSMESNVVVKYFYQRTGGGNSTESGDDLFIEYYNSSFSWVLINQHLGSGADMTVYDEVEYSLPGDAYHNQFRLRIRNIGSLGTFDDWFVDDVFVGRLSSYAMNLEPESASLYDYAGNTVSYMMTVHNTGGIDDDYNLTDSNANWTVSFYDALGVNPISTTGNIPYEDSLHITVKVAIPGGNNPGDMDMASIYAASINDPGLYDVSQLTTVSAGLIGGFPWIEPFPADSLYHFRWLTNIGVEVNSQGIEEPSVPYSVNLDGGNDTLLSETIDLSGKADVMISYYYQRGGGGTKPSDGEDLWVEYRNNLDEWTLVAQHPGSGEAMTTYELVSVALSVNAYHADFQIRLRSNGSGEFGDDWFVDDIRVEYRPNISETHTLLDYAIEQGDSSSGEITIANAGPGDLNYSIVLEETTAKSEKAPPDWMTLTSYDGTVLATFADTIDLKVTTATLDSGSYSADIIISSNDPDQNPITLPVTLIVTQGYICGDADNDGEGPNVADLTYLVDYIFKGGTPPPIPESSNVDGSPGIYVSDLVVLVDYIFKGGADPVCEQ